MFDDFQKALAEYKEGDPIGPLRMLVKQQKIPYQTRWLNTIDDLPGFEVLIDLFGLHARDPDNLRHIFQDLVVSEWEEGIDLALRLEPNLVNICIIEEYPYSIMQLISYTLIRKQSQNIIKKLLTPQLNYLLVDYNRETVFHQISDAPEILDDYIEVIEQMILSAPVEVWDLRNDLRETPGDISPLFPEGKSKTYPVSDLLINADKEERIKALEYHYDESLPYRQPMDMYLCLIGKQKKRPANNPYAPKLFFNSILLAQYLEIYLKKKQSDFVINAILFTEFGRHSTNIFISRENSGPISWMYIDGLNSTWNQQPIDELVERYSVQTHEINLVEKLQHSDNGCRVIAAYLAGRFSNPAKGEKLQRFIKKLSAAGKHEVVLADFPADMGLLLITQSLKQINRAIKIKGRENVLKEYPGYEHKYKQGLGFAHSTEYTDIEDVNVQQNLTLERKNRNQLKHAKLGLELDLIPNLASLLCIKDLSPFQWEIVARGFLKLDSDWTKHYEIVSYTMSTLLLSRETDPEPEHKKQKMSSPSEQPPTSAIFPSAPSPKSPFVQY